MIEQDIEQEKEQDREQEQETTIEWYKAQTKELTDLRKKMFHLCHTEEDNLRDEYFPDMVIRKIKELQTENKELKSRIETIATLSRIIGI